MPNFKVLLEGAWLVRDVKTADDAIGVAISEAGKRLNQNKMDFVDVEVGQLDCPGCGECIGCCNPRCRHSPRGLAL